MSRPGAITVSLYWASATALRLRNPKGLALGFRGVTSKESAIPSPVIDSHPPKDLDAKLV